MTNIFCDEPIIAVHEGQREYRDIAGANAFFDCYHSLSYHVTKGYRIVLETEHFYISLDVHGVSKSEKTCSIKEFAQPGEWFEPCIHELDDGDPPWVDYESTLFVGERLLHVTCILDYYLLTFDDFELKVVPHALNKDDFPSFDRKNDWAYFHVLGADRHLKKECSCGGRGELLLDFVCDYVVRCKKCKKSTWAEMIAQNAIEEWNEGDLPCDLSDIVIENGDVGN